MSRLWRSTVRAGKVKKQTPHVERKGRHKKVRRAGRARQRKKGPNSAAAKARAQRDAQRQWYLDDEELLLPNPPKPPARVWTPPPRSHHMNTKRNNLERRNRERHRKLNAVERAADALGVDRLFVGKIISRKVGRVDDPPPTPHVCGTPAEADAPKSNMLSAAVSELEMPRDPSPGLVKDSKFDSAADEKNEKQKDLVVPDASCDTCEDDCKLAPLPVVSSDDWIVTRNDWVLV